jgi:hypothetical protein
MDRLIFNCFFDIRIFQLAYSILHKEELHYIPQEYMPQMSLYPYRMSIFAYTHVLKTTSISNIFDLQQWSIG